MAPTAVPSTKAPTAAPTTPVPTTPVPTTSAPTPTPTIPAAPTIIAPNVASDFVSGTNNYPLGVLSGQYVKLSGQKQAVLNISRVEIFSTDSSAPYIFDANPVGIYGVNGVTLSSSDTNNNIKQNNLLMFLTKGTEVPTIQINIGKNSPIYKITVYNRVDSQTQRICGVKLSIVDSNNQTVYASDPVICKQLVKVGNKTLLNADTKKATVATDSTGPIMGTDFDDSYQDLSIYNNCGSILYFPSSDVKSKKIYQGRPLQIFRGVWCSGIADNSQLIMRNDFTFTLISPSITSDDGIDITDGLYKPYGTIAVAKFKTKEPLPDDIDINNLDDTYLIINYMYEFIVFQGVKYYINNALGWWRNKETGSNRKIPNIKLKYNNTIVDQSDINIGTYTYTPKLKDPQRGYITSLKISSIPQLRISDIIINPYIGSWLLKDGGNVLFSITVNPDMTCTNTDGVTYPATDVNPSILSTGGDRMYLAFTTRDYTIYRFDSNARNQYTQGSQFIEGSQNYYTTFQGNYVLSSVAISIITTYNRGDGIRYYNPERFGITLLRNPFLGTWKSTNTINKIIMFNRDTTVTVINGQPLGNYSVNPPNSPLTSMFGDGYITGNTQDLVIVYNQDTDTILIFKKNSFENPIDTLIH
jgi:hypothetical protein